MGGRCCPGVPVMWRYHRVLPDLREAAVSAVPDELVERAKRAFLESRGSGTAELEDDLAAALAAVADDLAALGRPPVCRDGCQVAAMLAGAEERRQEPAEPDDPMRIAELAGLGERFRQQARRECAAELRADDLTEDIAARVHEAWMETKRQQGVTSRPSEWGEEQIVPYDELSERAKDLDRGTVRAVLAALADSWEQR